MKVKGRLTQSRLGKAELSENTLYHRLSLSGDIAGLHNKIDKCKNKLEMEPLGVISGQPPGRKITAGLRNSQTWRELSCIGLFSSIWAPTGSRYENVPEVFQTRLSVPTRFNPATVRGELMPDGSWNTSTAAKIWWNVFCAVGDRNKVEIVTLTKHSN